MHVRTLRRLRNRRGQFSLGGLKCCCGCSVSFTVYCGSAVVNGATVTIKSGSTVISSGTTNSSGQVTLTIPAGGTYTVLTTGSTCGSPGVSVSLTLACNGNYVIQCCCGGCPGLVLPSTFHVTEVVTSNLTLISSTLFSGLAATFYPNVGTIIPYWTDDAGRDLSQLHQYCLMR
jgi:hypothetical protein